MRSVSPAEVPARGRSGHAALHLRLGEAGAAYGHAVAERGTRAAGRVLYRQSTLHYQLLEVAVRALAAIIPTDTKKDNGGHAVATLARGLMLLHEMMSAGY
jgi:hypothetical protein